jgi:hypothetical protein
MPAAEDDIAALATANNKLLKALIGLLAVKDRHLLGELRTVFAMAGQRVSASSPAEARTWARVRSELDQITDMVEGDDDLSDGSAPSGIGWPGEEPEH